MNCWGSIAPSFVFLGVCTAQETMDDILFDAVEETDLLDRYCSTIMPHVSLPSWSLKDVPKFGSVNNLTEVASSQHSVTSYSFLAFAEKYLSPPNQYKDSYEGAAACSLSSCSCSPKKRDVSETTDLGRSYVFSLFGSSLSSDEPCESYSGEMATQTKDKGCYEETQELCNVNYSQISEYTFDSKYF